MSNIDEFLEDKGDEDSDDEELFYTLDPSQVFVMGEHAGAKAFKNKAIEMLDKLYKVTTKTNNSKELFKIIKQNIINLQP